MSECQIQCVCMDLEPGDVCTLNRMKIRKARKQHECCECRETINPGEEYCHESSLFDGGWATHKTCMSCKRIRDDCMKCGWLWGEMWDELHEANCDAEQCICPPKSRSRQQWEDNREPCDE